MTYTPETQAILAAVMSGNCCDKCGAPSSQRHFDECPSHPWNTPENLLARIHSMELVLNEVCQERSRLHEERDMWKRRAESLNGNRGWDA